MGEIDFTGVPTFRITDVALAKRFYVDYLGFHVDWEHYYAPNAPVYMQVSRDGLRLHLSENERFPEASVAFVEARGLEAFQRELAAGANEAAASPTIPSVEATDWGTLQLELRDPFGNLLRFNQEAPGG